MFGTGVTEFNIATEKNRVYIFVDFVEGRPFAETKFKPKENPTKQ